MLHAAPADYAGDEIEEEDGDSDGNSEEEEAAETRVTFLVNIWIDHIPDQCTELPRENLRKMGKFDFFNGNILNFDSIGKKENNLKVECGSIIDKLSNKDYSKSQVRWTFRCNRKFEVCLPLCGEALSSLKDAPEDMVRITLSDSRSGELIDMGEASGSDDGEGEESEEEEEEEEEEEYERDDEEEEGEEPAKNPRKKRKA